MNCVVLDVHALGDQAVAVALILEVAPGVPVLSVNAGNKITTLMAC